MWNGQRDTIFYIAVVTACFVVQEKKSIGTFRQVPCCSQLTINFLVISSFPLFSGVLGRHEIMKAPSLWGLKAFQNRLMLQIHHLGTGSKRLPPQKELYSVSLYSFPQIYGLFTKWYCCALTSVSHFQNNPIFSSIVGFVYSHTHTKQSHLFTWRLHFSPVFR